MKKFTSNELRKAWIDFYTKRGHVDCKAVSLVSDGSTGVMFNVAGMQPLMPYLLGKKHPLGTRLCNIQGCVRTNDIESVGDQSHGTFFEMMGSWSLGDYFKEERCKWSFELLTEVFGFDADHLAATVFAGDDNAPRDEEGAACRIASGFRKDRIFYLPAEDNWWGLEFGPCGPDSEMFYVKDVPDCGPNCGPGCHCGKYTEIGNDVFMQYEKHQDGTLTPLEKKNVDTGWGLERNLAFLNGTSDVYRTDIHAPVIAYMEKVSGQVYDKDAAITRSMRIVADHTRTAVMLIGDEARLTPSNAGPGYVLRRLIRRAVRHARVVGIKSSDIIKCASIYIDEVYAESYPNLVTARTFVLDELKKEIERFESTLENGMKELGKILDSKKESGDKTVSGKEAFYLYDTFGFPLELTVEMAGEEGLTVDEKGFEASMEEQKELARRGKSFSQKDTSSVFDSLDESLTSQFLGYDALGCDGSIIAIAKDDALVNELSEGSEGTVITDKTTFYGTMGGQVGDIGEILGKDGSKFVVNETVHVSGGRTAHIGKMVKGSFKTSDKVSLNVDKENRAKTCRNHSATHLLQAALREVLGKDAHQAGSYQDPERTRFDFSYGQAMTKEQIEKVEEIVNSKIEEDIQVTTDCMGIEEAKKTGAMALFGEKYGDSVRVVSMGDFSKELCGGTHVKHTGDIAAFKILSESGVASGVRRIEAITGRHVTDHYKKEEEILCAAAAAVKTDIASLPAKVASMQEEIKTLMAENEKLKAKLNSSKIGDMSDKTVDIKGVKLIATSVKDVDMNGLRDLGDKLKSQVGEGVVFIASSIDGKACLLAMATDGAIARGAHAGNLIKEVAVLVGGGGGGRPNMAQAGGKNPAGIEKAVAAAHDIVLGQIKD
ncbi:MAG: alanine--tRNA ligase [Lachnospiraceae bacterium]|nr:alanine--tRNA ligase [Lachnospiraceae bacterium]